MKKHLKFTILLLVIFFLLSVMSVNICWANDGSMVGSLPENCRKTGDCGLNDFVLIFSLYYKRIFGIVGSLALLMFIYGGLMIMLAGETTITGTEKTSKVNKGKDAIRNAIIGLVIVFTTYMIIQFIFTALDVPGAGEGGWATSGWFK